MKDVYKEDLVIRRIISSGFGSIVYELKDGSIFKLFTSTTMNAYKNINVSLERKIKNAKVIKSVPEIMTPNTCVYDRNNNFVGSVMDSVSGISYNDYDDNLTLKERSDLVRYADMYNQLESIVKRGNKAGIIFPDLCTCDNILILADGTMRIIDYDGLQINDYGTIAMSSTLGNPIQYLIPKYLHNNLFTSNLDKKSLIMLYFISVFNIDLNKIGVYNPYDGKKITLDDAFNLIKLEDNDIKHKVWRCLQSTGDNEFLGNDVYKIANEYDMQIEEINGMYIKSLRKK